MATCSLSSRFLLFGATYEMQIKQLESRSLHTGERWGERKERRANWSGKSTTCHPNIQRNTVTFDQNIKLSTVKYSAKKALSCATVQQTKPLGPVEPLRPDDRWAVTKQPLHHARNLQSLCLRAQQWARLSSRFWVLDLRAKVQLLAS